MGSKPTCLEEQPEEIAIKSQMYSTVHQQVIQTATPVQFINKILPLVTLVQFIFSDIHNAQLLCNK